MDQVLNPMEALPEVLSSQCLGALLQIIITPQYMLEIDADNEEASLRDKLLAEDENISNDDKKPRVWYSKDNPPPSQIKRQERRAAAIDQLKLILKPGDSIVTYSVVHVPGQMVIVKLQPAAPGALLAMRGKLEGPSFAKLVSDATGFRYMAEKDAIGIGGPHENPIDMLIEKLSEWLFQDKNLLKKAVK